MKDRKLFLDTAALDAIDRVVETVHRLRAPGGCPWDRKQTHQSLRTYLLEETYETLEVLDQIDSPERLSEPRLRDALREEFGDVLLQILLHSEMASETGAFSFSDVARALDRKLIHRHPHVFGETQVSGAEEVVQNWEQIKKQEKGNSAGPPPSALDGIPKPLPALMKAEKTIERVSRVGFQWPNVEGPLAKLEEEIRELAEAVRSRSAQAETAEKAATRESAKHIEEELGDLLFSVCNVAYALKVRPEEALRGFLEKFERRFRFVESSIRAEGRELTDSTLEEMDRYWEEAKKSET